jgi:tRNA(Ile)-lysidine synthase TilS/MesJ
MSAGNRHLTYKAALNDIEVASPGAKHAFYFGFLARAADRFADEAESDRLELTSCLSCGAPTTNEVCAFCRLVERAGGTVGDRPDAVPVFLGPTRSAAAP